jgi:hypothetical protein
VACLGCQSPRNLYRLEQRHKETKPSFCRNQYAFPCLYLGFG